MLLKKKLIKPRPFIVLERIKRSVGKDSCDHCLFRFGCNNVILGGSEISLMEVCGSMFGADRLETTFGFAIMRDDNIDIWNWEKQ